MDEIKNGCCRRQNPQKEKTVSNCHRRGGRKNTSEQADTMPDQDSANSKYVVENDDRERRDGPGGEGNGCGCRS